MVSAIDPQSASNPPPCTLSRMRSPLLAGIFGGVMTRTGTPAIVSLVNVVGYIDCISLASCFCQFSARERFSVTGTSCAASEVGSDNHCCASGLIVSGTGTTLATCAVPCSSIYEESDSGMERFAQAANMASSRTAKVQRSNCDIGKFAGRALYRVFDCAFIRSADFQWVLSAQRGLPAPSRSQFLPV